MERGGIGIPRSNNAGAAVALLAREQRTGPVPAVGAVPVFRTYTAIQMSKSLNRQKSWLFGTFVPILIIYTAFSGWVQHYSLSMFFAKLTPDGSNPFAKIFYGLVPDDKNTFAKGTNGTFFVGGRFNNPISYEGITLSPTAYSDMAVFKVNADGSPVWARRGTGNADDLVDNLAGTTKGDVLVAGTSQADIFQPSGVGMAGVIAPGLTSKTLCLIKVDSQGNGQWAKSIGSSSDAPYNLISGATACSRITDEIVWAGDFSGSLNLVSPAIQSVQAKDAFALKLSPSGNVLWARSFGGSQDQFASAVRIDDSGNIYVAGFFLGQITIGNSTFTTRGQEDIFVAKLRNDGTILWAKQIGWTGHDRIVGLGITKRGELVVVGTVEGGVLIDGVFLESTGPTDGFVAKIKGEGSAPLFVAQPQSQVISAGMTLHLQAQASSDGSPISYQWWYNGSPLAGKTNSTLTISNVALGDAGSYSLVASNDFGDARSLSALVSYTDASTLVLSIHPSLTIFGTPGKTYRIEYATETVSAAQWTVATNLTLSTTPRVWLDPDGAVGRNRFYRVLLQNP